MDEFVIGTRGSALAQRQTALVIARLREAFPELAIRSRIIRTTGDRHPHLPIGELTGVGFFVKELEYALLDGTIDAAVHSMKDLPSAETGGLVIGAILERDDPRDALVAREGITLRTLGAGARVGTSSARRAACLLGLRPDLTIVPVRGNVDTRVRKVETQELEAVCLAVAGLRRAGLAHRIAQYFSIEEMLPAPGQGALGIQVRENDESARHLTSKVDHAPTHTAVLAERIILRRLEAGCRLPLAAYAALSGDQLTVRAAIMSPDGRHTFSADHAGPAEQWRLLAQRAAEELYANGAGLLAAANRSE